MSRTAIKGCRRRAYEAYKTADDPDEKAEAEGKLLAQVNVYGERQEQAATARLIKLKGMLSEEQLEGLRKKGAKTLNGGATTEPAK
jgi:hypothetical protein